MINYLETLRKDKILSDVIDKYGEDYGQELLGQATIQQSIVDYGLVFYQELVETIIGQQLSNKVARVISQRVRDCVGEVIPKNMISIDRERLRECGLSYGKIKYIIDLTENVLEGRLELDKLMNLDNETIVSELTKVKGIGRWTAEMFLIFNLGRTDVFSLGDGGLASSVKNLYGITDIKERELLSQNWIPYRSIAALYLWRSLDNQ